MVKERSGEQVKSDDADDADDADGDVLATVSPGISEPQQTCL